MTIFSCLLLKAPSSLGQNDVEPGWERSFQAGGTDANGEFMGGSTIVHLVGHKEKLYAGNSYWLDSNHYWYGGSNPNTPWGQVLRLDEPGGDWEEDLDLGPQHLRVELLESIVLTTDENGAALPEPVNLLVAAEYNVKSTTVDIDFWIRDDSDGTWDMTVVRSDTRNAEDLEVHSVRALQVHQDNVTGVDRVFLSVGQIGIASGVFDPDASGQIVWDANTETGWVENRILSVIEANDDLLYSAGRKIYRRNDGNSPTYTVVEDVSDLYPASQNQLGGIRGMSPMPNPNGPGESIIFAMTESNTAPGWILRLDPNGDGTYTRVVEDRLDTYMSAYLSGNPVYFILAAYNEFTPVLDPFSSERLSLIGFESWIGGFTYPLWGAGDTGGFYRGAMYAIRDSSGDIRLAEVNGLSTYNKPATVATTTIEISPFPEDNGQALYFGGHDGNHMDSTNMAWIFRSSVAQALRGTTINAGRGDIPVQVPTGYDPAEPMPLVITLHGYSGNSASMASYLKFSEMADAYGYLYINPDGTTDPQGNQFWNATDACCDFYNSGTDDSGYILDLINAVKAEYNVDADRVFLVGLSNGAFMSYRMAGEYSNAVSAIVSQAGAAFKDPTDFPPTSPMRVLQIHGTSDDVIYYDGGNNFAAPYPGAIESVENWATFNGCSSSYESPAMQLDLTTDVPGAETTIRRYASGCNSDALVELWTIAGGAHVPAPSSTLSQNILNWLFEYPYAVGDPAQAQKAAPGNVTSLGSSNDAAGNLNVGPNSIGGGTPTCSPCGYQNLQNSRVIDGSTATIFADDQWGSGDTEALGFSNFGFSIPTGNVIDGIQVRIAADVTDYVSGVGNSVLGLTDNISTGWVNTTAGVWATLDLLHLPGPTVNTGSPRPVSGNEVGYSHGGGGGSIANPITTGGANDLWGSLTTITPAMVNSSSFGLVTHSQAAAPGSTFEFDGIEMIIHHHDPNPSAVWVDFNAGPGTGLQLDPFNTLSEGVTSVESGGEVRIFGSTSGEIMVISKAMTIKAFDGPAIIGSE